MIERWRSQSLGLSFGSARVTALDSCFQGVTLLLNKLNSNPLRSSGAYRLEIMSGEPPRWSKSASGGNCFGRLS
jgi:hypothetical protein